ncbi:MAG: tetratricopeptide repeat protein [Anaerolineales bacterium]|nr:tetratricopeptide repeat protein [Anaerolineales bacterium]
MSLIPISKTKIIPPRRRAEILTRKRLLDFLFESLDKKLILVSAPAGYGKTSLLIDLANQSELPCCWLALDELDRDPQRFIAYLIASLAERFPKFGSQSLSMLGSLTSIEQDMERMLITLVNETIEQIPEHFILVLDDFHIVYDVQPIQALLNRFIQLVDENCHVVISSRTLTDLPELSLMVARDQVRGLSFSDLAFHSEEIQALLIQNKNIHISDDEARNIIEKTEGWITGLQFSGNGNSSGDLIKPVASTGIGLSEFLGRQVLDRQPPDLRQFLLRTSMLDEFDASLCERVLAPLYSQPQHWQNWISAIVQNNLFVLPVGKDGRWLRYHHLFRDFLRERLEEEYPKEVNLILSRLGKAYEELGEWEKAHYIYKKLSDNNVLAEMIEHASMFMLQRALLTLESWLNDLPPYLLRTRPGLLSIRGTIVSMKGDLQGGLVLLDQAVQSFRESQNDFGLILTLSRRASTHRFLGNYDASLHDADEIIQFSELRDEFQMFYAEALRIKGLVFYRLGQSRQASQFLKQSLTLYTNLNDETSIPMLLMETGIVYNIVGNYSEAGMAYEKALQIWKQIGNLSWQANLLNNMGVLHHSQGEYEKATLAFEEGLICAQRSGSTRMEATIALGLGDLYAELEDFDVARRNYQHAQEIVQDMQNRFLLFYLIIAQANLALSQKKIADVHQLIRDSALLNKSNDSFYEKGMIQLCLGRLALLEGNLPEAVNKLKEAESCFSEDGRKLESESSRIWLAAAYYQVKDHAMARQMIKNVLNGRGQVADAVLVTIHQAREWLNGLQKDDEVGRIVSDLLTRAGHFAEKIPSVRRQLHRIAHVVQIPNPHLIIEAFGQASVTVGGNVLTLSDWQTQSVRDLLFYFLTSRRPLTKEQVGETLWPDLDDPQKIKLRFKNEIYRLRRAVGQDVITYEGVFYSFNHSLDFEYDVEAFESFLERARSTTNPEEQIALYQKAVDLVHGPFLKDVYADWAMLDREHLGQTYLSALLILAGLFQKQAQLEQALMACQRAVDYDDTFESAYALSMQVYHRMGNRPSIKKVYQACHDAMQRLGLTPSPETEELYRRLVE